MVDSSIRQSHGWEVALIWRLIWIGWFGVRPRWVAGVRRRLGSVIGLWFRILAVWISRHWTRFYGRINAPVIWDWFLSVAGRSSAVVHGHGPFEACYFFITLLRPGLVNCPLLHTLQQVNVEIGC